MGMFDILRGRGREAARPEVPAELQKVSLKLSEAGRWLDAELSERLGALGRKAGELCGSVLSSAERLRASILELGKERFIPEDKTYAAINMAKDTFVNKSAAALALKPPANAADYGALAAFRDSARQSIDAVKNAAPKQAFFVSRYFGRKAAAVVDGVKKAEAELAKLSSFMDGEGALLRKAMEARDRLAALSLLEGKLQDARNSMSQSASSLSSIQARLASKRAERDSFMASDEWAGYSQRLQALSRLQLEVSSAELDANNMLSVLRRPMKKLAHSKDVAALPDNPFRDIVLAGGDICSHARAVLDAAASGEIELKSSEIERVRALIEAGERIDGLKKAYMEASAQYNELKSSMDERAMERSKRLEGEVLGLESGEQRIGKEIGNIESEIKGVSDERERQLAEVERAVQEATGKKADIIVQEDAGPA